MGGLAFGAFFWLPFLLPAAPVAAACWTLGRRRVAWRRWEYTLLVVPFLAWLGAMLADDSGKSLSNAVAEPFWLGCGVAAACVLRVIAGRRLDERVVALSLHAACCALAVGLWALVPTLPE